MIFFSNWRDVISGIPQGSFLGPLLFIIYINDLVDNCDKGSKLFLYADDTKLFRHIMHDSDTDFLQKDLLDLQLWLEKWLLKLNINKCKVVSFGHKINFINEYYLKSNNSNEILEHLPSIKDLGVTFDCNLKFDQHIHEKVNKAYSILGLINRNFKHMSSDTFIGLYRALVRSHLEYANCVWSPYRVKDIEMIEKVQMRATKMVQKLRNFSYEDRLKLLNLPSLKYRRMRGDMIQVFKIISGLYDINSVVDFNMSHVSYTRGNIYKMQPIRAHYNIRKFFFSNRIVTLWNSLPNHVIISESVNIFKNRLDKFWEKQDFKYEWNAGVTGTGSRRLQEVYNF